MGYSCRTLLRDTLVRHSSGTLLLDTLVGLSSSSPDTPRTKVVLQGRQFSASSSPDTPLYSCTTRSPVLSFQPHRLLRVLKLYYKVASSQLPAPQIAPRTKVVLPSHQFSSSSSPDTPRTKVVLQSRRCSPAFRALDTHDLRRGLRGHRTNRTLACISRTRHARSPQRVARAWDKSHSRLHFAHLTRTISAEGCARMGQIALSPAFRTLDTHDLRRGLRVKSPKRAFRTRLPQKLTRQSLQNERFVRDFLQKLSGNTHRSTHITQPCQAVSRFQPLQTTSAHTPIPMGQRHSPLPQLTTSRFPAPATNLSPSTRLTRTKYCACHDM